MNNDTASLPTPANVAQLSIGKFVVWVERGVGTEQYPDFPKTEYFHRPVLAFIPCSEPVGDFPKAVHGVVRRKDKRTAVTFKVMMSSKSLVAACADLVRKAPLEAENIKGKEDKINVRCAFITDIYVMMVDTADYQGDPKDQANSVLATCHVQGLEYIDPMSPAEFVMLMDDEAVDRLKLAKSKPTSLSWVFLYKYRGKSIGQSQVKFTMQADLKKVLEQRLGSDQLSGEAYITQGQVNQVAMALAASIRVDSFVANAEVGIPLNQVAASPIPDPLKLLDAVLLPLASVSIDSLEPKEAEAVAGFLIPQITKTADATAKYWSKGTKQDTGNSDSTAEKIGTLARRGRCRGVHVLQADDIKDITEKRTGSGSKQTNFAVAIDSTTQSSGSNANVGGQASFTVPTEVGVFEFGGGGGKGWTESVSNTSTSQSGTEFVQTNQEEARLLNERLQKKMVQTDQLDEREGTVNNERAKIKVRIDQTVLEDAMGNKLDATVSRTWYRPVRIAVTKLKKANGAVNLGGVVNQTVVGPKISSYFATPLMSLTHDSTTVDAVTSLYNKRENNIDNITTKLAETTGKLEDARASAAAMTKQLEELKAEKKAKLDEQLRLNSRLEAKLATLEEQNANLVTDNKSLRDANKDINYLAMTLCTFRGWKNFNEPGAFPSNGGTDKYSITCNLSEEVRSRLTSLHVHLPDGLNNNSYTLTTPLPTKEVQGEYDSKKKDVLRSEHVLVVPERTDLPSEFDAVLTFSFPIVKDLNTAAAIKNQKDKDKLPQRIVKLKQKFHLDRFTGPGF